MTDEGKKNVYIVSVLHNVPNSKLSRKRNMQIRSMNSVSVGDRRLIRLLLSTRPSALSDLELRLATT